VITLLINVSYVNYISTIKITGSWLYNIFLILITQL